MEANHEAGEAGVKLILWLAVHIGCAIASYFTAKHANRFRTAGKGWMVGLPLTFFIFGPVGGVIGLVIMHYTTKPLPGAPWPPVQT